MASKIDELIVKLANTITDENLFNPYNQICKNHDLSTAPGLRQGNLRTYLDSFKNAKTDTLWMVDVADFHSTKLTGVPLVEPLSFKRVEGILGLTTHFEGAHKNGAAPYTHRSHNEVWNFAYKQKKHPLLWNILPFYPHSADDILTKRDANNNEYIKYSGFLRIILDIYKPKSVFAIGPKAKTALDLLNVKSKLLLIS
jgi:hypothetical protein